MSIPKVNYGIVRELLPNQVYIDAFYVKKEKDYFDAAEEALGDDGICIWGDKPRTSSDLREMANKEAVKL
ncbi:hypothetical protein HNV12_04180 [Methanococcoides sp. SA1]|nr:hypothetical protein [Methanococcoides sp. SA1]